MDAHVQGCECKTHWHGRRHDNQAGKDGQLKMSLRQRRGRGRNPDRVLAGITRFESGRFDGDLVFVVVVMVVRRGR